LFGEDELSIGYHFETTAARRDHFDVHVFKTLFECSRQTDGYRLIVSNDAILDR